MPRSSDYGVTDRTSLLMTTVYRSMLPFLLNVPLIVQLSWHSGPFPSMPGYSVSKAFYFDFDSVITEVKQ